MSNNHVPISAEFAESSIQKGNERQESYKIIRKLGIRMGKRMEAIILLLYLFGHFG